ncbi:ACT domain-containing protein [Marinomonas primoryensis]|uniref:ACT domain-containing protein n=1 Tax=Marinomonas primoryensis TaxID=178399 RepID=UPI0037043402
MEESFITATIELDKLLRSMSPELVGGEFVFCTIQGTAQDYLALDPIMTFIESEGLTLILLKLTALDAGLAFESVFSQITLTVHSSLDAIGLTAAVSNKLTEKGISANVVAAYYHNHIFVQTEKTEAALKEFSAQSS